MDNAIHKEVARMLLKYPDREFTIRELAKESKTPYATCWRAVKYLEKTGAVLTKKIGSSTAVQLNKSSPYIKTIKTILRDTPHRLAFEQFKNQVKKDTNVKKIYLFGSVAQNKEKPESDVDVAITVKKQTTGFENKINKIMTGILKKSQIKIVPLTFTEKNMPTHFKKEIEKGELAYERD